MENTIENKARFFAQYWGQRILKGITQDLKLSGYRRVMSSNIDRGIMISYIELKPLSQITNEEAIEVAKIITNERDLEEYRFSIQEKGFENTHHSVKIILSEWNCKHPSVMKWLKAYLIQIDTEDSDIICGIYADDGRELEDEPAVNILHSYDFLRSKGYALPYLGISITEQIEFGWVKLKSS
jgi:hypothetical protein